MVRTARQESDNEKLGHIISDLAGRFGYEVLEAGWARTTWSIRKRDPESRQTALMAVVESFATTNGQVRICAEEAMDFVTELGKQLEANFEAVREAVIIEDYDREN